MQSTKRRWNRPLPEKAMPLFDVSAPPANRSVTSRAAARSVAHASLTIRERTLEFIVARGQQGATAEEISDELALRLQTVCPRLNELAETRQIVDSGRTRNTRSGRSARVVVVNSAPQGGAR